MKKKTLLLLAVAILSATMSFGQLKKIGKISYYQLPTIGIKYEKVDAYVTLDQSDAREMMGAAGGLLGGEAGQSAMAGAAEVVLKDITEVYDTWALCPDYIKVKKGAGTLRLDVKYKPDDLRRPMTTPPVNSQRGGYVVPYKVFASMKVTDPSGKILFERNYGELSGDFVSKNYITAADSDEGIGTYEMACIRAAMMKARAELFGMYGFGLMKATLNMGPIKEIKTSKKPAAAAIAMIKAKKGFVLTDDEKAIMKTFVDVIEKDINLASDKTRWMAYHNLAVGYAWLQDETKAKEYFAKEFEDSKASIELVKNFGKKGSKSYTGKDLKRYQGYSAIEEFVNYYPKAANMYPELLAALARPLKQFTDFYTYNDLLCQVYGLDMYYQFLPFDALKGAPKSVKGSITQDGNAPIEFSLSMYKNGQAKELNVESINDDGDKVVTKAIQPIFNDGGDYITTSMPGLDRFMGPSKGELRRLSAPVDDLTRGEAGKILKSDGMLSKTNEKIQMLIDLKGMMYFNGSNDYSTPNAFYSKFLAGSDTKFGTAKSNTDFTATTIIDANGVVKQWKWDGKADMGWGISFNANGTSSAKNTVKGNINRNFTVTEFDENGLPKSITLDSKVKAKMVLKEFDWQKVKSQYESYNSFWSEAGKPKVKASATGFDATSSEIWPCNYTVDAQGNWTEAKVGPYTISRTIKY